MLRKLIVLVVLISSVLLFSGCVFVNMMSDGSFEYKEYGEEIFAASFEYIMLDNVNGSIDILPSEDGQIKIQYVKRLMGTSEDRLKEVASEVIIQFQQINSVLQITTMLPYPRPLGVNSMGADYRLYLPVELLAKIDTTNGSIQVRGMRKDINLKSTNGTITITDHLGNIVAKTSNGRIEIERADGLIKANTSNGSITMNDIGGSIYAESSNGRVNIDTNRIITCANVKTSNASVNFKCVINPEGIYDISTSNGSLNFWINKKYGYNFYAKTSNGRVKFNFPIQFSGTHENTYINGALFGGGTSVSLRTSNGSIIVHEMGVE